MNQLKNLQLHWLSTSARGRACHYSDAGASLGFCRLEEIMNRFTSLVVFMLFALIFTVGQAQQLSAKGGRPYPNELPNLKLYQDAKWKSVQPYISTRADVDRILGEPV